MKNAGNLPQFLSDKNLRLLLFGGKGGVGKTSCATATALHLAKSRPDSAFLLVSTDPAHSVGDSLHGVPPENLSVLELDADQALAEFKTKHEKHLREIARRGTFLDDDEINKFLDLSIPGLDELMAFLQISKMVAANSYQTIIVDLAPTGHTLRLLQLPELLDKWLKALDSLLGKHRYMLQLFRGSYKRDEVDEFLLDLANETEAMRKLLRDEEKCRFIPVTLGEKVVINETERLLNELSHLQIPVREIIFNRLFKSSECEVCSHKNAKQQNAIHHFTAKLPENYECFAVPLFPAEVQGAERLSTFWNAATLLKDFFVSEVFPTKMLMNNSETVEFPAALPSEQHKLLLFAGKGGVGKTTLASATAMRLANEYPNKRVLLFSTDPAHSLSDVFDLPFAGAPTKVSANLAAMEIIPDVEFQKLKTLYADELETFLQQNLAGVDLTFDAEVLQRIFDLAPPGLDEVMCLTRVLELAKEEAFDTLVLDTAPTGHLLRLLELPEIIDQWLKAFFGIFLRYKNIFRMPRLTAYLVELSKNLRALRSMLGNPAQTSLYAVSILTEMSLAETQDLISATERLSIPVAGIFLNQATPNGDCPLCSALHERESGVWQKFQREFANHAQVLVYQQTRREGRELLESLQSSLFAGNFPQTSLIKQCPTFYSAITSA